MPGTAIGFEQTSLSVDEDAEIVTVCARILQLPSSDAANSFPVHVTTMDNSEKACFLSKIMGPYDCFFSKVHRHPVTIPSLQQHSLFHRHQDATV